jgi:hypothetical protein
MNLVHSYALGDGAVDAEVSALVARCAMKVLSGAASGQIAIVPS